MTVSRADRARLKQMLAQNGCSQTTLRYATSKRKKRRYYEIAMSYTPRNPCTPWAVEFSEHDRKQVREAFMSRL